MSHYCETNLTPCPKQIFGFRKLFVGGAEKVEGAQKVEGAKKVEGAQKVEGAEKGSGSRKK